MIPRVLREWIGLVTTGVLLAVGLGAQWLEHTAVEDGALLAAAGVGLLLCGSSLAASIRQRRLSVDVLAVIALAGSVLVHEYFAAAVVSLMLATGQLLEARAQRRAARDLSRLVQRAPRVARIRLGSGIETVPVEQVEQGAFVVVGPGEVTPVDGRALSPGIFDESALTGEPLPVERGVDELVRSGVVNAGSAVEFLATSTAEDSTYAGVVRLVEQASASSAPFVRLADRIAAVFVPLALFTAAVSWYLSGDPVRGVAVLVIATPCPLLLAAPIAIMAGLTRATRSGVIVKGGAALERLATGRILLIDKTGTLTRGRPELTSVTTAPGWEANDVLMAAASVDQLSPHVLASAVVAAARERGLALRSAMTVHEIPGFGIRGVVDGRDVLVGKESWVVASPTPPWVRQIRRRAALDGSITVFVAIDEEPVAGLVLDDPLRPDAPRMIRSVRRAGISRVVLVTGDRLDIADAVGRIVGADKVYAEQDPRSKVAVVTSESAGGRTIMVGDGVNDAPAMAGADVGVALASRGASAASETADVVLTVDRIDALGDAILIARRSRWIAFTAACVGMGLALIFMAVACVGRVTPTVGALIQEGIDVLAISIALTGLLPWKVHTVTLHPSERRTALNLRNEHQRIEALVELIRARADELGPDSRAADVSLLLRRLEDELLPHEQHEEEELLPVVARALGGPDPTGALSRTHAEIERRVTRLRRLVDEVGSGPMATEDIIELRRDLYGLYAIMHLHNAQEDEAAFSLLRDDEGTSQSAPNS